MNVKSFLSLALCSALALSSANALKSELVAYDLEPSKHNAIPDTSSKIVTSPQKMDTNLSALELTRLMGNGINLGNTLEAWRGANKGTKDSPESYETLWGQPVTTQALMKSYKKAGFDSVRIPVAWMNATDFEHGDYVVIPTKYGKDIAVVLGKAEKPVGIRPSDIIRIDRKAAVRLCLNKRSVRIAGNQELRRIMRHQVNQLQQGADISVLSQHVSGHHHTGIADVVQDRIDPLLAFAESFAVKIADMKDGVVFQIRRQVQDCQFFFPKQHPVGKGKVHHPQKNNQDRQQEQNRGADMMFPVLPDQFRSKNVLIPLPSHGPLTSFPEPIIGGCGGISKPGPA